jgi:hypothetical protein
VPSGPAWLARPTSTNLHALDGCPPRSAGTGARLSAREIASTLTGRRSSGVLPRGGPPGLLSQFLSHSPPSGAVHQCSLGSCLRSSRTVADAGERGPALLESVLGATPQEFESPILRHPDLRIPEGHRSPAVAARPVVSNLVSFRSGRGLRRATRAGRQRLLRGFSATGQGRAYLLDGPLRVGHDSLVGMNQAELSPAAGSR